MEKNKVYIIGPNNSFQEELKAELELHKSFIVSVFPDGETCFMSQAPEGSIIIVDYVLGEGNWTGVEFMEEYKRIHPDSKFIVVSSSLNLRNTLEVVSKGAIECALKTKSGIKQLTRSVLKNLE